MDKKKILVVGDSAKLHTGFALVIRKIFTYLTRTGKYDITQLGWFHQDTGEEVIFPILQTMKDSQGRLLQEDKYAHRSFPSYVEQIKPDLVWCVGDTWMQDHVAFSPCRNQYKLISYVPIDGHPCPSKWGKFFENPDIVVFYGEYGEKVAKGSTCKANQTHIYHGVDTEVFHPLTEEERWEARRSIVGVGDEEIVLGVVARNQPRKAFDKIFEAYFYILNGFFAKCEDCKKITVFKYDLLNKSVTSVSKCKHCHSLNIKPGSPRKNVRVYLHGAISDVGWDLLDLQKDYNLQGKIMVNPSLKVGVGVSEYTLNGVYNSFDIFTLPTRGEGFGLPVLEAMSAAIPIVVTDYSAHPEWCRGAGELIPAEVLEAEPLTNIRRAVIDMDLYVTALIKLIDDPKLRKSYGEYGRKTALKMDWKIINRQWETVIDRILYPSGQVPNLGDTNNVSYELEAI